MFTRIVSRYFYILLLVPLFFYCSPDEEGGEQSDLLINSMKISPHILEKGDTADLQIVVKNVGLKPSERVTGRISFDEMNDTFSVRPLNFEDTMSVVKRIPLISDGTKKLIVHLDELQVLPEADEDNNSDTISFSVKVGALSDLSIESIQTSPANPFINDNVLIKAVIKNIGFNKSNTTHGQIIVGSENSGKRYSLPELQPDETFEIKRTVTAEFVGLFKIEVLVDDSNAIQESDENNNSVVKNIEILEGQRPDFTVQNVKAFPGNPKKDTVVLITAEIKNSGYFRAPAALAMIKISPTGEEIPIPVPDLDTGDIYPLEQKHFFKKDGIYAITVVADEKNSVTELSEDNNMGLLSLVVGSDSLPDITIKSISLSPEVPRVKDSTLITVVVQNNGAFEAPESKVNIQIGDSLATHLFDVPKLSKGKVHPLVLYHVFQDTGTTPITAVGDFTNSVLEVSEENNSMTIKPTVHVEPMADLMVNGLTYTPSTPTSDDTIEVTGVIQNIGDISSESTVLSYIFSEKDTFSYTIPKIEPNEMIPFAQKYFFDSAGLLEIDVMVDRDSLLTELDKENNKKVISAPFVWGPRADLKFISIETNPQNPVATDVVEMKFIVSNVGTRKSDSCEASVMLGANAGGFTFGIPALAIMDTFSIIRYHKFDSSGVTIVVGNVDYMHQIREVDEDNNILRVPLNVVPPPKPDYHILDITSSPKEINVQDTTTFSITIKNSGRDAQLPSKAYIKIGTEGNPPLLEVPALDSNETVVVSRKYLFNSVGAFIITGVVDVENSIDEGSETNNSMALAMNVDIGPLPDLLIDTIITNPDSVTSGDTARVTVSVTNIGQRRSLASAVLIKIGVDDSGVVITIPPLEVGGNGQAIRDYYFPLGGEYPIIATVDPLGSVVEQDETNNDKGAVVTVAAQAVDLIVKDFYVSPSPAGVGDTTMFYAIIHNRGDTATIPFISAIDFGGAVPAIILDPIFLEGKGTDTIIGKTVFAEPQELTAYFTADFGNGIEEPDENNNFGTAAFNVIVKAPDIVIDSFTIAPEFPNTTDSTRFDIYIRNNGNDTTGEFSITLFPENGALPVIMTIPSLNPNEKIHLDHRHLFVDFGVHQVMLMVDPNDEVLESDETNNSQTITVAVIGEEG